MIRIEVQVLEETSMFRFQKTRVSIGSSLSNDLVLPHRSVGEHHALIFDGGTNFSISPLGTDNETTLNDRPLFDMLPVHDGDLIHVGAYALVFREHDPYTGREAEFLRALDEDPRDDDTRAVYSDWLEEHGRNEEADFIRLQLSLARTDLDTEGEAFLLQSTRLRRLGKHLPLTWRRTVARPPIENCSVRFELSCPKRWSDLTPTSTPTKRFCGTCKEHVHYAPTIEAARALALDGACVAVDLTEPRRDGDLRPIRERFALGGVIAPPRGYGY